jgi:hypothetical protein
MIMLTLCPPFQHLNQQTDFNESYNERYGIGGHSNDIFSNILQVTTTNARTYGGSDTSHLIQASEMTYGNISVDLDCGHYFFLRMYKDIMAAV